MRTLLDYCEGSVRRQVPAGSVLIQEGSSTGHLFVLIEGQLEVLRGEAVVAVLDEPGAVAGEMSVLLDRPHTATVRTATASTLYEFENAAAFAHPSPPNLALDVSPRYIEPNKCRPRSANRRARVVTHDAPVPTLVRAPGSLKCGAESGAAGI